MCRWTQTEDESAGLGKTKSREGHRSPSVPGAGIVVPVTERGRDEPRQTRGSHRHPEGCVPPGRDLPGEQGKVLEQPRLGTAAEEQERGSESWLSPTSSSGKGRTPWAPPKCPSLKGQREWPLFCCSRSFCPHTALPQAEKKQGMFCLGLRGAAELENILQALLQAWSGNTQQSRECCGREGPSVPDHPSDSCPQPVPSATTLRLVCRSHAELSCLPALRRNPWLFLHRLQERAFFPNCQK